MNRFARCALAAAVIFLAAIGASAQGDQKPAPKPPSTYDKIWAKFTDWYNDKENPVVQRVVFTGRFHEDYAAVEADEGEPQRMERRGALRLGPRITMFRDYLVHTEIELNPQEQDPFYVRLTDAYVAWQKHPKAVVTVGKQSVPFTQEGATSSRELVTIDRSNLANNIWFTQEYMPGRQRVRPRRAMDVSRRRLLIGRDESRVRRFQRRRVHAGHPRLRLREESSACGRRC